MISVAVVTVASDFSFCGGDVDACHVVEVFGRHTAIVSSHHDEYG